MITKQSVTSREKACSDQQIQILNARGKVVKEIEVVSEKEIIETYDLNTGLYLVLVKYDNSIRKSAPMIKH